MKDKEFEKLFQDHFKNAEEIPSTNLWNKIEAKLDDEQARIIPFKKRNIYLWIASAAASVIFAIGIGYTYLHTKDVNKIENTFAQRNIEEKRHIAINPENSFNDITENSQVAIQQEKIVVHNNKALITKKDTKLIILPEKSIEEQQPILEEGSIIKTDIKELEIANNTNLPTYQVTEIEDIKPLIENEEEEETMLASTEVKENKNIITSVLNSVTNTLLENTDITKNKEIKFYKDDEGSLGLSIINTLAKNRNKKRK